MTQLVDYGQRNWPWLVAAALLIRFAFKVFEISADFPNLFQVSELLASSWPLFISAAVILLAAGVSVRLIARGKQPRSSPMAQPSEFAHIHAPGLSLALIFFIIYFVLASVFNRADFNNNNVFFAADTHQWLLRLADPSGSRMEMRAVHPLAFLLLRPLAYGLSFVSGTDLFHAVIFLLAVVGSLSVFLVWGFIRDAGSVNYAFLFTSIFGISTAQLVFNSITETYIFSEMLLVLFFVLLQKKAAPLALILTGIGIFGVAISNLVQAVIGLTLRDLKLKRTIVFGAAVVIASAGLSLVNKAIYPNSALFFTPASYGVEDQHLFKPSENYGWPQRARLVASDIFGFSVVAPEPYLQSHNKDDRGEFPKFNFMQGTHPSRFAGTGRIAIWIWLAIFGAGLITLGGSLKREGLTTANRFALAFFLCLVFNFAFHLFYGFEPFLYAADWAYALIFLVAFSLRPLAENGWLLGALLVFLALLTLNNLSFLYSLMKGLSPFIVGA